MTTNYWDTPEQNRKDNGRGAKFMNFILGIRSEESFREFCAINDPEDSDRRPEDYMDGDLMGKVED